MSDPALALDDVAVSLGGRPVLRSIDLSVAPGEVVALLGANGSGKSTLIRLLAGSEMPDRGTIRRYARVSFPLGFGGTFHGGGSRSGRVSAV